MDFPSIAEQAERPYIPTVRLPEPDIVQRLGSDAHTIDRRRALRTLIGGVVTVGLVTSLLPDMAEATPLAMQKDPGRSAGEVVQEVQADSRRPGPPSHRPPSHRPRPPHRRRRRWVCWWHRGRRHCGWRWV
jgi:hypothetical protein